MKKFPFLVGVAEGMKEFGHTISTIVNVILLTITYVIGVGLTSLLAKLTGKKPLQLAPLSEKATYWEDLNLKREPIKEYYRQF